MVIFLTDRMKEHFENIQIIADSTTLPHVMQYLSSRIAEELDLMQLTEKLMKGKDQPNTLTAAEKLELWDRLKILSMDWQSANHLLCLYMCVCLRSMRLYVYYYNLYRIIVDTFSSFILNIFLYIV